MSTTTVTIQDSSDFEKFYEQAKLHSFQDTQVLKIENVTLDQAVIQELRHLLPNLQEFVYNKPTTLYYGLDNDEEEDEDDEDDHGACGCHRHDRYE